jgi:hypothetical protein
MKAKKKFKLALLGPDSLRGKEIKNVFGQKKVPAFELARKILPGKAV